MTAAPIISHHIPMLGGVLDHSDLEYLKTNPYMVSNALVCRFICMYVCLCVCVILCVIPSVCQDNSTLLKCIFTIDKHICVLHTLGSSHVNAVTYVR